MAGEKQFGRAVEQELRLYVCERDGQRFLEARRQSQFRVHGESEPRYIGEKTELVLPWGADAPSK